jgi:hypothetical protein
MRSYLEPDGAEVDCVHYLSDSEYVGGFLRLPTPGETGRVRFLEDIPALAASSDVASLDPVSLTLTDGKGGGIDACLLGCFVSSTRFSAPLQPQFPITLAVNRAIVGSTDAGHLYETASLRCAGLLGFLGAAPLAIERAVELGASGAERAHGTTPTLALRLREAVEVDDRQTSGLSLNRYGEITLKGAPRTIEEWARTSVEQLCLFAFLSDQALRPERISSESTSGRVDFYASWPEAGAPHRTEPLLSLPDLDDRIGAIVVGWNDLLQNAHDLVDHLVDFQLFREHRILTDQLLSLSRALELYFDHGSRFDSKYRPTAEHRSLVDEAVGYFPSAFHERHGDWMGEVLRSSNQKRLVAQLEAVLIDLGPEVLAACQIGDPSGFAVVAKSARNHYTHPAGPPKPNVPDGRDLVIHVNRLWFVVRACVLRELGLSQAETAEALKRSSRRHYLLA